MLGIFDRRAVALLGALVAARGPAEASDLEGDEAVTEGVSVSVDAKATYTIVGVPSKKCVQITDASKADRAGAQLGS